MDAIPFLDLKAQYGAIRAEIRAAMDRVMESQQFILGPEVEALEREVASYCGCRYAIGVSSGTDALLVTLMALELRPGDEVLTSAYSFFATAGTVARLGGRPIFVDVDPETFNIDASAMESKITARTRAILPVHLFGQMADMTQIAGIASRHGLPVIEDAAQAIGAELDGRRAGAIGNAGCFSFYPTKNLAAAGEAGMVTTNDADLADRIRRLRNHGARGKYDNDLLGGNFRMDAIQAAVLRVKLRHLDVWTAARRKNAALYAECLPEGVRIPAERIGKHVYNQFVILHPRRDALMKHLKEQAIGCEVYYPLPLHLQKCFEYLGCKPGDFPASERAARESLALPIYPELTPERIRRVCDSIAQV